MVCNYKVGIPVVGSSGWLGGIAHMEHHVKAVTSLPAAQRPKLCLVVTESNSNNFTYYKSFIRCFDELVICGRHLPLPTELDIQITQLDSLDNLFGHIDFYFPVNFNVLPDKCSASWIHDFQHKYLSELFPSNQLYLREELCRKIAEQAKLVFCSSYAVEKDFKTFYPHSKAVTRVLPLRIVPEEAWYAPDPLETQHKYKLPDRFVLCCNQFWSHKNHRILFKAIAHLKASGNPIHLVCTGALSDFRNSGYFNELKNYISELGIDLLVHILGVIPREDQIQLIRRSLCVIQPSLFEGLSLIVQECRTLGKSIILSDLGVHFEHEYGLYFNRNDAVELADKIASFISIAHPGPDLQREYEAKALAQTLAQNYARNFCTLVEEAIEIYQLPSPGIYTHTRGICSSTATVATSINPLLPDTLMKKTTNSWLRSGFKILSLNTPDDIEMMQDKYPDVDFYPIADYDKTIPGAACVKLSDVFMALQNCSSDICGIVDSTTYFPYEQNFSETVKQQTGRSILYGPSINLETVTSPLVNSYPKTGFIFFDKTHCHNLHSNKFLIEYPLWDCFVLLSALTRKIPLKHALSLPSYRLGGAIIKSELYVSLGRHLQEFFPSQVKLTDENIASYHNLLFHVIQKHSVN